MLYGDGVYWSGGGPRLGERGAVINRSWSVEAGEEGIALGYPAVGVGEDEGQIGCSGWLLLSKGKELDVDDRPASAHEGMAHDTGYAFIAETFEQWMGLAGVGLSGVRRMEVQALSSLG